MSGQEQLPLSALKGLVPFASLAETHLHDLQRKGRVLTHERGRILFKRGEAGGALVWLLDGSVDLADASFDVTAVTAGSERARRPLDDHSPWSVTAVSTAPVRVFVVPKDFVDLVLTWDEAGNYLVTDLSHASGDDDGDWMSSLLSSAIFAAVPPANIQRLFAKFEEVRFPAGAAVVTQGEPGDYFYVVKAGRCVVTRRRDGPDGQHGIPDASEETLAELGPGDVFGEDALIGNAPRNATVTMLAEGALMRLGQIDFEDLLQNPVLEYIDYDSWETLHEDPATAIELLDVRLPEEYDHAHLPESRNLPLHMLRQRLEGLDRDRIYVLTCDGGRRSVLGAYILSQEGFDARVLEDPPDPASSAA